MNILKKICACSACVGLLMALCSCGTQGHFLDYNASGPDFNELEYTGSMELDFATGFTVDEYDSYSLITIDSDKYLVVPENCEVPRNLPDNTTVIKQPLDNVYQVSSAIMDMIVAIDALDKVAYTGTKESDWYVDEVKEAMAEDRLTYAGKYSQPDYEMLLAGNCSLAVENTMILHNPETKEKLESLGIPVMIEKSSYESHPLGRLEWIKLYGLLFGRTTEAEDFFDSQIASLDLSENKTSTGKKVAFFYITSNGAINVKKPGDYVARMVSLAGGEYVPYFVEGEDETSMSTINMTMEDFYVATKDADVLIYNGTIVGDINSVDELIEKSSLFADYKAVKEGNVYATGTNFYQQTTRTCMMIEDIGKVLAGDEEGLNFLVHLD